MTTDHGADGSYDAFREELVADAEPGLPARGAGSQGARGIIAAGARACAVVTVALAGFADMPAAAARPSDPVVVIHAVLDEASVGDIVGAAMGWEDMSTMPVQDYRIDLPVCNDYADVGLPEVYNDLGLASFNSAAMQESPTNDTHYVKQAVGVFTTDEAASGAFHRILDRTDGCAGQTTAMHINNGATQVWSFTNGAITATDAAWSKQEPGIDRRCFIQTRLRENVLLQAKVCQSGDGGPAVNALAGAMQNTLGQ
jgi:PknH-like extracellular domain